MAGFGILDFADRLADEMAGLTHRAAIRPEKLRLSSEQTNADVCVQGTVVSSSYWGDQSQLQVAIEGCDDLVTVAAHNLTEAYGKLPSRGERVWLSASRDAFLRFPE